MAGLALAAAGVLDRRVTGRRDEPAQLPPAPEPVQPPDPDRVDAAEVAQARSALADELARRASSEPD